MLLFFLIALALQILLSGALSVKAGFTKEVIEFNKKE